MKNRGVFESLVPIFFSAKVSGSSISYSPKDLQQWFDTANEFLFRCDETLLGGLLEKERLAQDTEKHHCFSRGLCNFLLNFESIQYGYFISFVIDMIEFL